MSERAVRYRLAHEQLSPPDRRGLFDRRRALAELAAKPKHRGGRKSTVGTSTMAHAIRLDDAATRYRLAKAQQEEIKLKALRGAMVDLKECQRRAAHIARLWRDRMDAWVG